MRFLFGLADRISVIHWGQVIAQGTPAELRENPWVQRSQPGSARMSASHAARVDAHRHLLRRDAGAVRRVARRSAPARWSRCSGPNGAGKTTTLRSILGLTPARARRDPLRRPRHHAQRPRTRSRARGIGWVPDDRRIFPTLTVARNLAIARKRTRFRAWTREGVLRDLQRARVPDAPRMREPVRRRDADGRDLARAARRARAWCCSTSRARAWRRRSCRT